MMHFNKYLTIRQRSLFNISLPVASFWLAASLVLSLASCAELQKQAETIKPTAKLVSSRITAIDFNKADLEFDLAVENKNPIPLKLSGMDYDFRLENQSLVSGVTAKAIELDANSTSKISLPVTVKFDDLKKLAGDLWSRDKLNYDLQTTFRVNLPVIGDYAIPVAKSGEFPVPKAPKIKLKDISLKGLSFSGAKVIASVEVDNPNSFDLGLQHLNYQLNVNNTQWGQGQLDQATKIASNGKGIIDIPLSLDLMSMGSAVYKLLNDKAPVKYQLTGNAELDTSLELLKNVNLPLDVTGTTPIR